MHVLRGVEDTKAFEKGLNNTTTARALLTLMEAIASGAAGTDRRTEAMIAILERQTFNDRIPAGLPAGTAVAHKTGEITKIPARRGHRIRAAAVRPRGAGPRHR